MIGGSIKYSNIDHLSAVSEKIAQTQFSNSKQGQLIETQPPQYIFSCSQDILPFLQNELEGSQPTVIERSSPVKFSSQLFRSCQTKIENSSLVFKVKDSEGSSQHQVENDREKQPIVCKHSIILNQESCEICKGVGYVEQNANLVKFFKYLIDFKLGKKTSYDNKKSIIKKKQVHSICSDFYKQKEVEASTKNNSNKNFTFRVNERKSQKPTPSSRCSYYSKQRMSEIDSEGIQSHPNERYSVRQSTSYRKKEIIEEISQTLIVHQSYQCDDCMCSPIIGVRYHCNSCEDFDQCQKCYLHFPHLHLMQKIDKTGKTKQLENMLAFLASPIKMSTSLRPTAQIKLRPDLVSMAKSAMT